MIIAEAFLEELAQRVAAKVTAHLGAAASTSHYGTGKAATLPPGKTRAWARRNIKLIPGARKIGRDWIVDVEAFDAWASERDAERFARKPSVVKVANDTPDVEALAEQALVEQGFRRTRNSAA